MSLDETLPWAITAGNNAGVARAMIKNRDEWMNYAKKLEKQVQFYRVEAANGWAAFRALRDMSGFDPRKDPQLHAEYKERKKAYLDDTAKQLEKDAPK